MNSKTVIIRWVQAIAWMALIFSASTDMGSAEQSSRFIGPILRWVNPAISDAAIGNVQLFVRKCAHLTEYAILAILLWRALFARLRAPAWKKSDAGIVLIIGILYAASDEFHQSFVPSRTGTVVDVLIDSFGVLIGLYLVKLYGRWKKWW